MANCKLLIGERVVLDARGGPPDAEYVLFDAGDLELHSTDPGTIREAGYRTTAGEARDRLEALGVTLELASAAADAARGRIAQAYVRGDAARRVVSDLGAVELFEGRLYDTATRRYEGLWLDVASLADDLASLPNAGALLQALSLAARLCECDPRTPVKLVTIDHLRTRRPGERSYHRVALDGIGQVPEALRGLAGAPPSTRHPARVVGALRAELLESVEARLAICDHERAREHLETIARGLAQREAPARGPLADPDLWAIEAQLSASDLRGVAERLEALEKARGKLPGTMYLRARYALKTGSEAPRAIAERMAALSSSMTSFFEVELLAAEAWHAAGEARRAAAFARDLVDNPSAPDELRVRALELLEKPAARVSAANVAAARASAAMRAAPPAAELPPPSNEEPTVRDRVPNAISRPPPPPSTRRPPRPATPESPRAKAPSRPGVDTKGEIPAARVIEVNASPEDSVSAPTEPQPPLRDAATAPPTTLESAGAQKPENDQPPPYLRGASQPPFRSDVAPRMPEIPAAPMLPLEPPRVPAIRPHPEPVERLSMPPGLHGMPPFTKDALPRTPMEARAAFTGMARELGQEYRAKYGVELRTDVDGIETMQRYLRERFPDGRISTAEGALDVWKHGALLSEILARTLGAYWVDVGPSELGYWAMLVPPHTRVWPIGRVLRFVMMGHKERDLVSYFLEIESRARG